MTTANYEGLVFKPAGPNLGASSIIATGATLQQDVMTTRDLLTGPTGALQTNDALGVIAGEAATIQINGVNVTASAPDYRAAILHTNTGPLSVLVFTAGGKSYALAPLNANFAGIASTVAGSTLNAGAATQISPLNVGLLPEDANTSIGHSFNTESFGSHHINARVGNTAAAAQERIAAGCSTHADLYQPHFGMRSSGGRLWRERVTRHCRQRPRPAEVAQMH